MTSPEASLWVRAKSVLGEALALPEPERRGAVERACRGDRELEAEVLELLGASAAEDDAVGRLGAALDAGLGAREDPSGRIGEALGGYRLVEHLGRGGMGWVFRAVPIEGAGPSVALKLLPHELATAGIRKRFELERDRLRRLSHPYVPALLHAGDSPEGEPFYLMDYVEGVPIDDHADERRLSVRDRIGLLLRVGEAVAHAHARDIVHRDLKPANILVRESGEPALLDFGIAKLLDPVHQGAATTLTLETRVFTPEYASPEQIAGDPVSPASDVYSLGAVGYRLVAGGPPGWAARGRPKSPLEVLEAHRDGAADLAARRATTPAALARALGGRLGKVLARACDPRPRRRYRSVEALSRDLAAWMKRA